MKEGTLQSWMNSTSEKFVQGKIRRRLGEIIQWDMLLEDARFATKELPAAVITQIESMTRLAVTTMKKIISLGFLGNFSSQHWKHFQTYHLPEKSLIGCQITWKFEYALRETKFLSRMDLKVRLHNKTLKIVWILCSNWPKVWMWNLQTVKQCLQLPSWKLLFGRVRG